MAKNAAAGAAPTSGDLLIRAIRAGAADRVRELIAGGGRGIVHEIPEDKAPLGVATAAMRRSLPRCWRPAPTRTSAG